MKKEAHQARLKILEAADRWALEVMRSDRILNTVEQKLFNAVTHYQRVQKSSFEDPINLPKPPYLPKDLFNESEIPTRRYSEIPTIPSPAFGITAIDLQILDIDLIDKLDE